MRIFKVGDRVRIRSWESMAKESGIDSKGDIETKYNFVKYMKNLCGRTATIIDINGIEVKLGEWSNAGNTTWNFSIDMLEPVLFEKCDLQNGDILIDGAGDKSIYYNGELYGDTVDLEYLNNDLTANPNKCHKNWSIVKIERPIKFETVFERNEEIKEMTMEELCKHFGCQVKIVKEEK
mgnify:FL=1